MNGIQPLFVSTPIASIQTRSHFDKRCNLGEQHANTYNDDISNGRKLSFMISKVCDLEAVVEDLKSSIILLVEQMAKPASFSKVISRNTSRIVSQNRNSSLNNAAQTQIPSQQIALELPQPSTVRREDTGRSRNMTKTPQKFWSSLTMKLIERNLQIRIPDLLWKGKS